MLSAGFVLTYITLGGLSSAIYNEVLQFFVILAGLIPLLSSRLTRSAASDGLWTRLRDSQGRGVRVSLAGHRVGGQPARAT